MYPEELSPVVPGRVIPVSRFETGARFSAVRSQRLWLHVLLFALTLMTTSMVGSRMQFNFAHNLPAFTIERDMNVFLDWWRDPSVLLGGLPFSLTLLTILLAHEFGHYVACIYYGVDASLPYFLPAPTLIGTFGAFIRIRSPIRSRTALFDIGIAGPIAGFVVAVGVLIVSLGLSRPIPPGAPPDPRRHS